MNNAYDQTQRELSSRYDLKNSQASLDWLSNEKNGILIKAENDFQVEAILDIYRKKLAQRGLSQKILDLSQPKETSSFFIVKKIVFKKGLNQDDSKKITKLIRDTLPKITVQVKGEEIRVMSGKKDELQTAIILLKQANFDFPLSFLNYK